jgi:hypothetical protein
MNLASESFLAAAAALSFLQLNIIRLTIKTPTWNIRQSVNLLAKIRSYTDADRFQYLQHILEQMDEDVFVGLVCAALRDAGCKINRVYPRSDTHSIDLKIEDLSGSSRYVHIHHHQRILNKATVYAFANEIRSENRAAQGIIISKTTLCTSIQEAVKDERNIETLMGFETLELIAGISFQQGLRVAS